VAPSAIKALGRTSMGALLGALGLRLLVAVDEAALAKVRHRLSPSRWPFKGNRAWALEMHAKAMAATTPEFRRARASLAATAANEKQRRLREAAADSSRLGMIGADRE
jgi:hypothetical protein